MSFFGNANNNQQKPTGSLFGTTSTTGGGLFGSTAGQPSTTPSTTQATSSLFGTPKPPGGGLFGASTTSAAPAATPTAAAPATGSGGLFGAPQSSVGGSLPTTTTNPAPASTGSLFGAPKPATQPTTGFTLGGTSTTSTAPAAPTSGSLFGTLGASTTKPVEKKDAPAAPGPTTSFGFGTPSAQPKKDAPAPTTTAPLFGALGSTTVKADEKKATTPALPSLGTSTTTPENIAVAPPSMLRGKTIEEIVTRWTTELESQVKEFKQFAQEVTVWDRALVENGNNLAALTSFVLAAEREQSEIEQSLDHIEEQQRTLTATLDAYEKSTQEIMSQSGLRALDTGPADTERDKNYMLATELHAQLDDLSTSLSQMVDSVNSLSNKETADEDPMVQIAQILNSHLESLQWIDGTASEVEAQVNEIERAIRENGSGMSTGKTRMFNQALKR